MTTPLSTSTLLVRDRKSNIVLLLVEEAGDLEELPLRIKTESGHFYLKEGVFCDFKNWLNENWGKKRSSAFKDSNDHISSLHWAGRVGQVGVYPCYNNWSFWLSLQRKSYFWLTFHFWHYAIAQTASYYVCVLCVRVCVESDWDITEAEEHCRSAGLLDGQRLRAAQLHQAGPRPKPHHAGRPGHPCPPGSDGFQVSLCVSACTSWCCVFESYESGFLVL